MSRTRKTTTARQYLTTHVGQDYVSVLREGQATDDAIVTIKYPGKADIALMKQFAAAPEAIALLARAKDLLHDFVDEPDDDVTRDIEALFDKLEIAR